MVNRPTLLETATEKVAREAAAAAAQAQLGQAPATEEKGLWQTLVDAIKWLVDLIFGQAETPDEASPASNRPPPTIMERIKVGQAFLESSAIPRWRQLVADNQNKPVVFQSPVAEETKVTSPYGMRIHPKHGDWRKHHGVDFGAGGKDRTPDIIASAEGIVLFADYINGYGNLVVIGHANGVHTVSAHLHADGLPPMGKHVKAGEKIGTMDQTGDSTGIHLHYEQRHGNDSISPEIAGVRLEKGVRVPAGKRYESAGSNLPALVNPATMPKLAVQNGGNPQALAMIPSSTSVGAVRGG
jgi:murein DD-endopeptidase MepM/ murein hydrolase activator NlpD